MTKMDDDVPATRGDLKAFATRDELEDRLRLLATKDDLKAFATKDDLKAFATRDELEDRLKLLATKDDLEAKLAGYATKEDIQAGFARAASRSDEIDAQFAPIMASLHVLAQNDLKLHLELRSIEEGVRRQIQASFESFHAHFGITDDQIKAVAERGDRKLGNVIAELDAHLADPDAHQHR